MRTLILMVICSAFLLNGCDRRKGIKVELHNRSSEPVTDIVVSTTEEHMEELSFTELNPGKKKKGFLDMTNNYMDGGYIIRFKRKNGVKEATGNGYYTNGAPLDRKVTFIIENDTVRVELTSLHKLF